MRKHVLTVKDPVVIMKEIISWLFKDPVVIMKEIMYWLFKDPVAWLNFDHAQSNNSKKWPKGWKDQIAPNEFFLKKKKTIKFPCTY